MSARIVECGTKYRTEARGGIPPFVCIEDAEHTALAVTAIRARKRRESLAEIVTKQ